MTRSEFIKKIGNIAKEDMKETGILASLTIAQAALESGWGGSGLTVKGNALFGIKANSSWQGKIYNGKTVEYYDGVNATNITAAFRAYDSWAESIADHSALLTYASRYKNLIDCTDYKLACQYIQQDGYATDPNYTTLLTGIIESYNLTEYDIWQDDYVQNYTNLGDHAIVYMKAYLYAQNLFKELYNGMSKKSYKSWYIGLEINKENAVNILKKNGIADVTINYLDQYIYNDALIIKLAKAMV
jgi:hypothetical protein